MAMASPPLSVHLALLLAPFLDHGDVWTCQAVCKEWHSIFTSPHILNCYLRRLAPILSPCDRNPTVQTLSHRLSRLAAAKPYTELHLPVHPSHRGLRDHVYTFSGGVLAYHALQKPELLTVISFPAHVQTLHLAAGDARGRLEDVRYCKYSRRLLVLTQTSVYGTIEVRAEVYCLPENGRAVREAEANGFVLSVHPPPNDLPNTRLLDFAGDWVVTVAIHAVRKCVLHVWNVREGRCVTRVDLAAMRPALPVAVVVSPSGVVTVVVRDRSGACQVAVFPPGAEGAEVEWSHLLAPSEPRNSVLSVTRLDDHTLVELSDDSPTRYQPCRSTRWLVPSDGRARVQELPILSVRYTHETHWRHVCHRVLVPRLPGAVRFALRCTGVNKVIADTALLAYRFVCVVDGVESALKHTDGRERFVFPSRHQDRQVELLGDDSITVFQCVAATGELGLKVLFWDKVHVGEEVRAMQVMRKSK